MTGLHSFITERPVAVLVALAILTAAALGVVWDLGADRPRLELDASVGRLLAADDEAVVFYERARRIFGSDETVVVALPSDDAFGEQHLARVARLTAALEQLPYVHHVVSLTQATTLRAEQSGIEFTHPDQRDFSDPVERTRLRADLLDNPLYRGRLVSADERVSSITVYFKGLTDREFAAQRLAERIYEIVDESAGGTAWVSGAPIVKTAIAEALEDSLRFTLPSILAIASLLLLLAFRNLRAALLPVLAIGAALACTLALPVAFGAPLNVVTILVPPLVMALGLAYSLHVVSEYYTIAGGDPEARPREIVRRVLSRVALPLLVSAATTALGLAALALNSLAAIREFSLLAIAGVAICVAYALTLIPATLALLPAPGHAHGDIGGVVFHRWAQRLVATATRHRRAIVAVALAVLAIAALGASRIETGTAYTGGLDSQLRARADFEAINSTLGGANGFQIVIDSGAEDTFVEPDNLEALEALQNWLGAQPGVHTTTSIVDHLKYINRSLNEGDPAYARIPASRALAKQLLLIGGGEEIDDYVDTTFRTANIAVRVGLDDTREIAALFERLDARLDRLPPALDATITGNLMLATRTVEDIARGQLRSILIALLAVLAVLATLFASLRTGLIAFLPNLLPVAVYFGALGLLGITLNPTTALIACIVLGVAVDDTIHFMTRFNTEARATGAEGTAVQRALAGVIRPVTYTSIVLVASFLLLTFSDLRNQVQFGALAAFTIAFAWLVDLTLTPALSSGLRIVTLWDLLRLDLGRNPQQTIPMFTGLSLRQARIFALLADISRHQAGSTLMTEGEQSGDEMFVVIDGELEAWVERGNEKIVLSRMRRGTTFGEAGVFGSRRSANVSVVSRTRLLRFTSEDLEQLQARFPRIAAVVYRNLNRLQAERAARDTQRMQ